MTKPPDQNLITRYQWKKDIHIFYLIPCDAKYLYYSGHTDHFYNQGPNRKWKNREWYVHIVRGPWKYANVIYERSHRAQLETAKGKKSPISKDDPIFKFWYGWCLDSLKEKRTFLNRCAIQYHITNVEGTQQLFGKEMLWIRHKRRQVKVPRCSSHPEESRSRSLRAAHCLNLWGMQKLPKLNSCMLLTIRVQSKTPSFT